MSTAPPPPATDRFASLMAELGLALRRYPRVGVLWCLLTGAINRVNRIAERFAKLAAQIRSGTVPKSRPSRGRRRPYRPRVPWPDPMQALKAWQLPQAFGWLGKIIQNGGYPHREALRALFDTPDMEELVAAEPRRMRRLLAPLCQMLGVPVPGWLFPPPPKRKARPRPSPQGERQEQPQESAASPEAVSLAAATPSAARPAIPASPRRQRGWWLAGVVMTVPIVPLRCTYWLG